MTEREESCLIDLVLAPRVLLSDLLLLLGREVVLDVERATNLIRGFALYHVGHRLACHVQQALYVQVVRSLNIIVFFFHLDLGRA